MDVNATSLLYERNYYYDMILNFYVSIDFLNLSWKFLSNIREAEDRTCFGLVKNQWNKLILPELPLDQKYPLRAIPHFRSLFLGESH